MGHVRCAVTLWYWYSDAFNSADSAPFCYFFFKFNLLAQFLDSKCGELVDEQLCVFGIKSLAVNSVKLEKYPILVMSMKPAKRIIQLMFKYRSWPGIIYLTKVFGECTNFNKM
jgi:hypothetical protein